MYLPFKSFALHKCKFSSLPNLPVSKVINGYYSKNVKNVPTNCDILSISSGIYWMTTVNDEKLKFLIWNVYLFFLKYKYGVYLWIEMNSKRPCIPWKDKCTVLIYFMHIKHLLGYCEKLMQTSVRSRLKGLSIVVPFMHHYCGCKYFKNETINVLECTCDAIWILMQSS